MHNELQKRESDMVDGVDLVLGAVERTALEMFAAPRIREGRKVLTIWCEYHPYPTLRGIVGV